MIEKHLKDSDLGETSDDLYGGGSERVRTGIMRLATSRGRDTCGEEALFLNG